MKLTLLSLALTMASMPIIRSAPTHVARGAASVGTVRCVLAASGKLSYIPTDGSGSSQLGLTNGGDSRQLAHFDNKMSDASVDFYKCDSRHEGYTNTPDKMFGHLQMQGTGACLSGDYCESGTPTMPFCSREPDRAFPPSLSAPAQPRARGPSPSTETCAL